MKFIILIVFILFFISCKRNTTSLSLDDNNETSDILFIRNGNRFNEICTLSLNNGNISVIYHYDQNYDYISQGIIWAQWSPDKKKIIVEGGPGTTLEYAPLWVMDIDGNFLQRITRWGHMPLWTDDNRYYIFTRRRGYFSIIYDIFITDLNSLQEDTLLTAKADSNSGYIYQLTDLFPNNNKNLLLLERFIYKDNTGKMHADDAELLIYDLILNSKYYLTKNQKDEGWGKISPDGNFIAYGIADSFPNNYTNDLYLMSVNGDSIEKVAESYNIFSYFHFCWSPDGKYIAVSRSDRSQSYYSFYDIYLINISDKSIKQLTNSAHLGINNSVMDW